MRRGVAGDGKVPEGRSAARAGNRSLVQVVLPQHEAKPILLSTLGETRRGVQWKERPALDGGGAGGDAYGGAEAMSSRGSGGSPQQQNGNGKQGGYGKGAGGRTATPEGVVRGN